MIKNKLNIPLKNKNLTVLSWVEKKQNKLRLITQSIKSTKKALEQNWVSFLSLKEKRAISKQEIENVMSIRNLKCEEFTKIISIYNKDKKIKTIELFLNSIKNNIYDLNNLEIKHKLINEKIMRVFDMDSEFTKNCLEGPKNLKILIKQYQTMNCFSKFFKSFTFSMPNKLLDYISEKNKLNPIESEKIRNNLLELARTSKICSRIQILSFVLFYPVYFSVMFLENRLINSLLDIKDTLTVTVLFLFLFPLFLFKGTIDTLVHQFKNFINDMDIVTTLILILNIIFWIILDIRRISYFKHFDAINEEANTIES